MDFTEYDNLVAESYLLEDETLKEIFEDSEADSYIMFNH